MAELVLAIDHEVYVCARLLILLVYCLRLLQFEKESVIHYVLEC